MFFFCFLVFLAKFLYMIMTEVSYMYKIYNIKEYLYIIMSINSNNIIRQPFLRPLNRGPRTPMKVVRFWFAEYPRVHDSAGAGFLLRHLAPGGRVGVPGGIPARPDAEGVAD